MIEKCSFCLYNENKKIFDVDDAILFAQIAQNCSPAEDITGSGLSNNGGRCCGSPIQEITVQLANQLASSYGYGQMPPCLLKIQMCYLKSRIAMLPAVSPTSASRRQSNIIHFVDRKDSLSFTLIAMNIEHIAHFIIVVTKYVHILLMKHHTCLKLLIWSSILSQQA